MKLTAHQASEALREIDDTARRLRQSRIYQVAGTILILWGILWPVGNLLQYAAPPHAKAIWIVVDSVGFAGTIFVLWRRHGRAGARPGLTAYDWRMIAAMATLMGFALLWVWLLSPLTGRQIDAFVPTVFMLGYVLAGLWLGRFFVACGLAITLLVVLCTLFVGDGFHLWMAVLGGGAFLLGGLYLKLAH